MPQGRYNIVLIRPPGFEHSAVFLEVAKLLSASLQSLSLPCTFHINGPDRDAVNILLGYHMLPDPSLLEGSVNIIYQLEQLSDSDKRFNEKWLNLMKKAAQVWDYSEKNVEFLRQRGVHRVRHVPIGFHPALRTIRPAVKDIDVLFYGTTSLRREPVLAALDKQCKLKFLFGAYADARDAFIARSKIVLSMHLHDANIFEQVRVSYLLNNERFVVAEAAADKPYDGMLPVVEYDQLVPTCLSYLDQPQERARIAHEGFLSFSKMPMTELLRAAL